MTRSLAAPIAIAAALVLTHAMVGGPPGNADGDTPPPPAPEHVGNWSAEVDGVRARLVEQWPNPEACARIALEIRNETTAPKAIRVLPFVSARLLDADKDEIPPTRRVRTRPQVQWGVVPSRSYLGMFLEQPTNDKTRRSITMGGKSWDLAPGEYELWVAIGQNPTPGSPAPGTPGNANVWEGSISVPPLRIIVK